MTDHCFKKVLVFQYLSWMSKSLFIVHRARMCALLSVKGINNLTLIDHYSAIMNIMWLWAFTYSYYSAVWMILLHLSQQRRAENHQDLGMLLKHYQMTSALNQTWHSLQNREATPSGSNLLQQCNGKHYYPIRAFNTYRGLNTILTIMWKQKICLKSLS